MAQLTAAAPMDDYQAQDDVRTLTRAEEIKGDAKRHQKALAHGKQQVATLKAVLPDADDKAGVKEPGEGTKAEEAKDAKLPTRGQRTATNMKTAGLRVAQRAPRLNKSAVI